MGGEEGGSFIVGRGEKEVYTRGRAGGDGIPPALLAFLVMGSGRASAG